MTRQPHSSRHLHPIVQFMTDYTKYTDEECKAAYLALTKAIGKKAMFKLVEMADRLRDTSKAMAYFKREPAMPEEVWNMLPKALENAVRFARRHPNPELN